MEVWFTANEQICSKLVNFLLPVKNTLAWTNTPAYYSICKLQTSNVFKVQAQVPHWVGSGLTCKHKTRLERLARDKDITAMLKVTLLITTLLKMSSLNTGDMMMTLLATLINASLGIYDNNLRFDYRYSLLCTHSLLHPNESIWRFTL